MATTEATEGTPPVKQRASCDSCRTKKLKCTGEQPSCARCVRDNVSCVYSAQKQMGRPKKRQRTGSETEATKQGSGRRSLPAEQSQTWSGVAGGYGTDPNDLRPWLLPTDANNGWTDLTDLHNVPGLASDNDTGGSHSSNSDGSPPTILNLAPELQGVHTHHQPFSHPQARDSSTSLLLDPTLATTNLSTAQQPPELCATSTPPQCACLSTLYLTLSSLQSMPPTYPFPFSLHPLREAMTTAAEVLACPTCPKSFIASVQNTQLVGTLLTSIAERFGRVLEAITAEAERAEQNGERKKFRLADLNTSTSHLHTGGLGCAAAFSIDLSPEEWRGLAKKVVRAEVHGATKEDGSADGTMCCPYFLGVTRQMTERQERWHSLQHELPVDCPKDMQGLIMAGRNLPREQHLCIKMAEFAEKLVGGFDWS